MNEVIEGFFGKRGCSTAATSQGDDWWGAAVVPTVSGKAAHQEGRCEMYQS
jgi:hypothetical protein